MYFKDFNPNKYNKNIYLADLCISNANIITRKELIDVIDYNTITPFIVFIFDISKMSDKNLSYLLYLAKSEESFRGSSVSYSDEKQILKLSFYVFRYSLVDYKLRRKYGFNYSTPNELIRLFQFWNGYTSFIPTKKAAARESSRLILFLFIHNSILIVSSTIFSSIYLLYYILKWS